MYKSLTDEINMLWIITKKMIYLVIWYYDLMNTRRKEMEMIDELFIME